MRLAILSSDGWHARDLMRAAVATGHSAELVDFRTIGMTVAGGATALDGFDAVIVRTMPAGSLEQVVFRMDALHALHARGVPILNPPRALETCVDKYLTLARLEAAGLPVPATVVCQDAESALAAFESLGRDVVVKPLFGSEGRGLMRIMDPELAWRTFRTLERSQAVLYVQQFIEHPGWDLRAFVLDGEVIASMRRIARGDWRTNVSQGARAEAVTLTEEQRQLAIRASEAVGTIAAGVDLLPGPGGSLSVIEVNAVPGWKALAPATGIDIARRLIDRGTRGPRVETGESPAFLACLWEATARKAGNVHPGAGFADMTYADFVSSAHAAAPELDRIDRPLGETILAAVRATRAVVKTNTNLGIILLLAPLARVSPTRSIADVLDATTVADAAAVYEAIRVANPGGLGEAKEQDVHSVPTVTLRDAMALAADRDHIARQYATGFADVLDIGVPALMEGLSRYRSLEPAIQHCQLVWLATFGDSLIARKRGREVSDEAARRARAVLATGGLGSPYYELDAWLRADGHARNPGTTADLVTASLYLHFRGPQAADDTRRGFAVRCA